MRAGTSRSCLGPFHLQPCTSTGVFGTAVALLDGLQCVFPPAHVLGRPMSSEAFRGFWKRTFSTDKQK